MENLTVKNERQGKWREHRQSQLRAATTNKRSICQDGSGNNTRINWRGQDGGGNNTTKIK